MNKEDLKELGVEEELADKILSLSKEELKGFIPKSRFDEVNEAKKAAEELVKERDESLSELSKKFDKDKDLSQEIERLKSENEERSKAYEKSLKEASLNYAIDRALLQAKAKDTKVARAAFDFSKVSLEGENLSGFDEQLKAVKKNYAYLFDEDVPLGTGGSLNEKKNTNKETDPFLQGLKGV